MQKFVKEFRTNFARRAGFPLRAAPFVFILGVCFVMATIPKLFVKLRNYGFRQPQIHWLVEHGARVSDRIATFLTSNGVLTATPRILQAAILTPLALVLLSLLRSGFTRNPQPFAFTILGLLAGVVTVPVVSAVCVAVLTSVRFLTQLSSVIASVLRRFFLQIGPFLAVVAKVALAGLVAWGVFAIVKWILTEGYLGIVMVTVLAAAVLAWAIHAGYLHVVHLWLQGLGRWISGITDAISRFLARYLAPVVGWITSALIIFGFVLFLVGSVVGFALQAGRTLLLPMLDARGVWTDRTKCLNVGIGTGLSFSLILVGVLSDVGFATFLRTFGDQRQFFKGFRTSPGYSTCLWFAAGKPFLRVRSLRIPAFLTLQ